MTVTDKQRHISKSPISCTHEYVSKLESLIETLFNYKEYLKYLRKYMRGESNTK